MKPRYCCRHCNEGCGTQYSPCAVCGVTILVHLRAGLVLPLLAHLRSITQYHRVLLSQGQRTCSTRYRKSSWLSPELWRNLRNWNKKYVNISETSTHFSNIFVFLLRLFIKSSSTLTQTWPSLRSSAWPSSRPWVAALLRCRRAAAVDFGVTELVRARARARLLCADTGDAEP